MSCQAAERDDLVEQAHRVAHRPRRLAREDLDGGRVGLDALLGASTCSSRRAMVCVGDQLEVVALAARQDRDRDLVDLGRREDELHVRRRLLERLQEGVPRRRREHVHLVDDVDLEAIARGAEAHALLEPAHLVDAVVAGAVDLLDVEVVPRGDLAARRALVARRRRGPGELAVGADAVQALGEQARARRLADAANPREEERVRDPPARDGVRERPRDVVLSDQVLEGLRAVLASENEVAHRPSAYNAPQNARDCEPPAASALRLQLLHELRHGDEEVLQRGRSRRSGRWARRRPC